jgi:putative acetyltransferase
MIVDAVSAASVASWRGWINCLWSYRMMGSMSTELLIRPIRAEEVAEVKRLIYTTAHELMFFPELTLEEEIAQCEAWGILEDIGDVQKNYIKNGGVFLVTMDGGKMVGTGAFHRYAEGVCELRRLYFLPEYQGQGLGHAMMMELLHQARAMGYGKMCLWCNPYKQLRAVAFYHRMGFIDVPYEGADEEELWMEMEINR